MAPITKLLQKIEAFEWTTECPQAREEIKQCYMLMILISPHWDLEFHVHIDASNLTIKVMMP